MPQNILVNEVGFYPGAISKKAVYRGDGPVDFEVVEKESGKGVLNGRSSDAMVSESAGETDYILDFSKLKEPGEYYIRIKEEKSVPFRIGSSVYEEAYYKLLKFFYLQRCGQELPKDYAGAFAHKSCHDTKARIYGTDEFLDVSGGWHDAGDYGRYIVPAAVTVADLLLAIEAKPELLDLRLDIPESGGILPDILAEIKYELDWMLKMQDGETGKVYHKVTCASFCGFFMPEEEKEELVICPPSLTATADFAAIMAMAAKFYEDYDKSYAELLRRAARRAYDVMKEIQVPGGFVNPEGITTGTYEDENEVDEQYWAAAQMYKEFGEERYRKDFEELAKREILHGYGWEEVGSFGNIAYLSTTYSIDADLKNEIIDSMLKKAENLYRIAAKESYGVSFNADDYVWGSNMYIAENGSHLYDACMIQSNEGFLACALDHIDYLYGKNPCNISFVTGVGTNLIENPHHRPSSAVGEAMPGMLSGGPNSGLMDPDAVKACTGLPPAKCFVDKLLSYSTNEVTIYWNSALILLMAQVLK